MEKKISKIWLTFAALFIVACAMTIPAHAAASYKCYTISSGYTPAYTNTGLSRRLGTIYPTDQLSVSQITKYWCRVTYPVSRGTKTGYIRTNTILLNTLCYDYTSSARITTYRRPGGPSYGYIDRGDKVLISGTKGGYTQVVYPAGSVYKIAWVSNYNAQRYIQNESDNYATVNAGTYVFVSALSSSKAMDVNGGYSSNGTNIQLWTKNNTNAQRFTVKSLGSGWYSICSASSGKSIDVAGGISASGVNVQLYDYNGSNAQKWKFYSVGNGYYQIKNALGYYLDVYGAGTADGTNIEVYSQNSSNAQKWRLEKASSQVRVPESTLSLGGQSYPSTMKEGSGFTCRGTVTSNYKITKVTVGIYNAYGSAISTRTVYPNAYSFNINSIDAYIHFSYAKAGTNYYRVIASDTWKSNVTLQNSSFQVISKNSGATTLSYGLYHKSSAYISCGFDGYTTTPGRHEGIDIQGGNGSSIYALTDGVVTRVTIGSRGRNGLSTIAIYDSSMNKTVVYLHSHPTKLYVGQKITRGQFLGVQDWRGVSQSSAGHTHVEVVNGRATAANKSVNDYVLSNSNPTAYWNSKGYSIK